jgi:hypothetical protein
MAKRIVYGEHPCSQGLECHPRQAVRIADFCHLARTGVSDSLVMRSVYASTLESASANPTRAIRRSCRPLYDGRHEAFTRTTGSGLFAAEALEADKTGFAE